VRLEATQAPLLNREPEFADHPQTGRAPNMPESSKMPSRPGEFHPEPLTDPDRILSHHPARAIARRLPPSTEQRAPPGEPVGPHQRR